MKLKISNDLSLPLDFVTSTQVILAQKGKGKTHTAVVEEEELLDANQQIVVIDPTDAHWGLRSSPDGRSTGYPIAVFGGDHGDVPLEPDGGKMLAEAIVSERFSAIISTENLSKAKELSFVADFLETLYRLNREAMHLFIDEADIFAPQKPFGGEMRTCGAADDIVRRGRKKGIGCTLITQRSSVLNKNVLSQADMLVALGCSHPLDLDAIGEWVKRHANPKLAKEMMESLPALPRGDAWVWNPAAEIFKRVTIRERLTFDSGRTPKPGEAKRVAKVLAPVDIARLGATIAAQVERQKESDPAHLRSSIAKLKAEFHSVSVELERARAAKSTGKTKVVEKTVLKDAHLARVEKLADRVEKFGEGWAKVVLQFSDRAAETSSKLRAEIALLRDLMKPALQPTITIRQPMPISRPPPMPKVERQTNGVNGHLEPRQARVLNAIAWWEALGIPAPTAMGVAFVAGYSPSSSSFEKIRSVLRVGGYIELANDGSIRLTASGRGLAIAPARPPSNADLHAMVIGQLEPRQGKMLQPLLDAWPNDIAMAELAEAAGYSVDSSSFEKIRSLLRSLGLATIPRAGYVRASDVLFPEHA